MRMMSFAMTTDAYNARTKDVTRRKGWANLKPGQHVMGVLKAMGLKKGEKIKRLHPFVVVKAHREPLEAITNYPKREMAREGFPKMTPEQYIRMYCEANGGDRKQELTRIEFKHL